MVKETSGRSCSSETNSSAPFASVDFVHVGMWRTGGGPDGGCFVRSSVCCAAADATRSATATIAIRQSPIVNRPSAIRHLIVHLQLSCFQTAWTPDLFFPAVQR